MPAPRRRLTADNLSNGQLAGKQPLCVGMKKKGRPRERSTGGISGWLEKAPGSWLRQLIRTLQSDDLAAMFMTSRQLARYVVQCTSSIELTLREQEGGDVEQQRTTITTLLDEGRQFDVSMFQRKPLPIPISLSKNINSLTAYLPDAGSLIDWGVFSRIQVLDFRGAITTDDVQGLTAALKQGHLQRLHSLTLRPYTYPRTDHSPDWEALACALGPGLQHLATTIEPLLGQVQHLTALHSVEALHLNVTASTLQQLCVHSTIRDVAFTQVYAAAWCESEAVTASTWDSLTLDGCGKDVLSLLPLASLKVLKFKGVVSLSAADCAALRTALHQRTTVVTSETGVARSGYQEFDINDCLCDETIELIRRLKGSDPVAISYSVHQPELVSKLYKALPASVQEVRFCWTRGVKWTKLWDDLPVTVTSLCLYDCDVHLGALAQLLSTAPKHLRMLEWAPPTIVEYTAWVKGKLDQVAPAHLAVHVKGYDAQPYI